MVCITNSDSSVTPGFHDGRHPDAMMMFNDAMPKKNNSS